MGISGNDLEQLIINRGSFSKEENQRIYENYFRDWPKSHKYLYDKFGLSPNDRILDIGCSYGMNLINFREDSVGVDVSDKHIGFCRSIGLDVRKINVEERFHDKLEGDKFSHIWCTDFIVHLTAPYSFLLQCRELMEDNGKLILQIPQYTPLIPQSVKRTYESPCHYYAFDYPTLKYLLSKSGYRVTGESGFVRSFPGPVNSACDWFLKRWGPNIWFSAEKDSGLLHMKKQDTFPESIKDLYRPE